MSTTPFNYAQDYTNELKLRLIGISSTVLATALTIGAVSVESQWSKSMILASALGLVGVSRVAEDSRLTQARINQDIVDISDASRQQKVYEFMTSGKPAQPATVLEIAPTIELPDEIQPDGDRAQLPMYDLSDIAGENHVAVIGGTGAGKSFLTQWLIQTYFPGAGIVAMDTDAAPHEWPGLDVVGQGSNSKAIARQMEKDLVELQRRCNLRANGKDPGVEQVRIVEELPTLAADIQDDIDSVEREKGEKKPENTATDWLKRLLRRGRKYKMMVVLVSQSFNVKSLKIEGEGDLRENLTVIYLGGKSLKQLSNIKDRETRENTEAWLKTQSRPALVDVGGILMRFPVPDLSNPAPTEVHQTGDDDDDVIDVAAYAAARTRTGTTATIKLDSGEEISHDWAEVTHKLIKSYIDQGFTKTMILESIGYKGSQYSKGVDLWAKLESSLGSLSD